LIAENNDQCVVAININVLGSTLSAKTCLRTPLRSIPLTPSTTFTMMCVPTTGLSAGLQESLDGHGSLASIIVGNVVGLVDMLLTSRQNSTNYK